MVIYPESFSVKPDADVTVAFRNLFNTCAQSAVNKNLTLLKGNYVFRSKNVSPRQVFISNTVGEDEYPKGVKPSMRKIALVIEGVKNMEIDCNGSTFIMDGKLTHIMFKNCENITLKNLTLESVQPNVHKITVLKASPFYVTFSVDESSNLDEENGDFYWYGTDYKMYFSQFKKRGWWIPTATRDNFNHIKRAGNNQPFDGVSAIRRIGDRTFTARYIVPKSFEEGQVFYPYPVIRDEVGILIDSSSKITLQNVKQHFNYSLALIAQNSADITIDGCEFAPAPDSEVDFASFADFFQFSMCRGKVTVKNTKTDAAGDDVCNVHGFHFKITDVNKDKITVKFCHPQSYGFECIRQGDMLAFIDPKTLLEVGTARVLSATLRDDYFYDLTLNTYGCPIGVGGAVENISACPDFEFSSNTINRIVTRGVLVTTRGRVLIENNKFLNTGASGVLISDDANYWYESGCVRDVTIRGNAFMNCDENAILIKPEVAKYAGPVHRNILIENNLFVLNNTHALNVSGAENVVMRGNTYAGKPLYNKWVVSDRTENLVTDCPKD